MHNAEWIMRHGKFAKGLSISCKSAQLNAAKKQEHISLLLWKLVIKQAGTLPGISECILIKSFTCNMVALGDWEGGMFGDLCSTVLFCNLVFPQTEGKKTS